RTMLRSFRAPGFAIFVLLTVSCSKSGESSSGGKTPVGGKGPTGLPTVPGVPDTSVDTDLPALPRLPNVTATATGDSVSISVEPVEGARDYRVYVLPNDSDIMPGSTGALNVRNATYRCAGDRQSRDAVQDGASLGGGETVKTLVDNQEVKGFRRTLADATL